MFQEKQSVILMCFVPLNGDNKEKIHKSFKQKKRSLLLLILILVTDKNSSGQNCLKVRRDKVLQVLEDRKLKPAKLGWDMILHVVLLTFLTQSHLNVQCFQVAISLETEIPMSLPTQ